jgi:phosphate transport system permease protein
MKTNLTATSRYRLAKSKLFFAGVCTLSGITLIPLFLILWELLKKGYKQFNPGLFTEVTPTSIEAMMARMNGNSIPGGILNGITGTILILAIAIIIAIPLGILTGIYLAENKEKPLANVVRNLSDLLQGIPSIVIGIVVYVWVVLRMSGY